MGSLLSSGKPPVADCPPDTVQLFQFSRGPHCPSLSPLVLKLETYLRMANIPYQNDLHMRFSQKHKIPWMKYNGEEISDSQFCIEYLNKHRGVDLNKHLTKEERAVARAFQKMIDDAIYWSLTYYRWVTDEGFKMTLQGFGDNIYVRRFARSNVKKQAYAAGIGRNSPEEIKNTCLIDFQAIADFLGEKKFLLGDEPCEVDCSLFGMMAQYYWQVTDGVAEKFIPGHFPVLGQYCERMKERYWPDWEECTTSGGTKEAAK